MKKLFSLIPLYAVVSWVVFIMILVDYIDVGHPMDGVLGGIAVIVGLFTTISSLVSVFSHLSELGWLKEREDDVVTYTDYLKEIKEHVKMITEDTKLDDNLLAKSNVDHPIISALHTLKNAENDVQSSKKREIADAVEKILRNTNHPELPDGDINFKLHVEGAEDWSWVNIQNNKSVSNPSVNPWNERQDNDL
jgi:arginine utilization protein RocB